MPAGLITRRSEVQVLSPLPKISPLKIRALVDGKLIDFIMIIILTFVFGPLGSIPYSFSHGLSMAETVVLISAVHVAMVPVWFAILELIKYRLVYENRLVKKIFARAGLRPGKIRSRIEANLRDFERRIGQTGFGLGVIVFTFTFGVSWAVLSSVLLNIKKNTIVYSIVIGALTSSIIMTLVLGTVGSLLPSPYLLYVIGLIVALGIFGRQKYRERKLLREISINSR